MQRKPDVYIAPLGAGMNREAARLARELRRHDLIVELGRRNLPPEEIIRGRHARQGAKYILIVGENEVKAGAFALKNLETGEQISVAREKLAEAVSGK